MIYFVKIHLIKGVLKPVSVLPFVFECPFTCVRLFELRLFIFEILISKKFLSSLVDSI